MAGAGTATGSAVAIMAARPGEPPAGRAWGLAASLAVLGLAAIPAGIAVGLGGMPGAALALALPLAAAIYAAPQLGAYLWLFLSPLIVGIERGGVLPYIRPNEALLLLVLGAVLLRVVPGMLLGRWRRPELTRIDWALGLLVLAGSLAPLLLRFGRGLPLMAEDVLYSFVLIKYLLIYAVFRCVILTAAQVRACLLAAIASAVPVAVIALLQVNELFGVPELLATHYGGAFSGTTGPITERATSTVASSFGVADIMGMVSAIVLATLIRNDRLDPRLALCGIICLMSVVAAGQFSGIIGIAVAITAVALLTGQFRRIALYALPVLMLAGLGLWPVVEERLSGFERASGLPQSWDGRIDNLQRFVLPELMADDNWMLGVRPAPQIPAPEAWRDWVFIESGYIWLLWIGGIPYLVAFLAFAWVGLRDLAGIARSRGDPIGIAAIGGAAGLAMITVLMLLDPHLTMRGGADLFFPLLALALVEPNRSDRP